MIHSVPLIDYQVEANTDCQVSGWGAMEWQGQMPEKLQVANVTIRDRSRCNWTYADIITDGMICANGLNQKGVVDVCQGGEMSEIILRKITTRILSFRLRWSACVQRQISWISFVWVAMWSIA